jgi:general stress protein YciG
MAKRKNPAAVALGRKGGKKGGKARAANLTPEQLSEIGRMGAAKRWAKRGAETHPASVPVIDRES